MTARVEADLHCHTTASDGLLTPWELVRMAKSISLQAVGITDHDTVSGWEEAENAGIEYGIEIIRGIEINTEWNGTEVHILGYEFDPNSTYLRTKLEELKDARERRMALILEKLWDLKIHISIDEVRHVATGEVMGRPHIAQVLMEHGFAGSIRDAFDRYIGKGAPAYVPRYKLTPEEGIHLIRKAKGVAVLAHPGINRLESSIPAWVEEGLQGLEVSHSEHDLEDERRCRNIAEIYNLIMTGGSDFHGEKRKPGVNLGGWGVTMNVVNQIRHLANK